MKIQIKITKYLLRKSANCPGLCSNDDIVDIIKENCVVALAIRDIFPSAKVYQSAINLIGTDKEPGLFGLSDGSPNYMVSLPRDATTYIKAFDENTARQRVDMPEIEFPIVVSDEFLDKYIGISQAIEIIEKSETLSVI